MPAVNSEFLAAAGHNMGGYEHDDVISRDVQYHVELTGSNSHTHSHASPSQPEAATGNVDSMLSVNYVKIQCSLFRIGTNIHLLLQECVFNRMGKKKQMN